MSNPIINYARQFGGIESEAAAIVFAVLYVPLLAWFVFQSFKRPTYVFIVLAFFCSVRISAFVIRSVLASSDSAGSNLSLLIAAEVLYSVGFFGLLYSAYTLVLDRELLSDAPVDQGILSRLTRNRMLFRLALSAAVAIGITGFCEISLSTNPSTITLGTKLRKASTIIFLVLTILLTYQTLQLLRVQKLAVSQKSDNEKFGVKNGIHILLLICFILLIREIFLAATVGKLSKQDNEHFWYPFAVVTEFLAVILYATPGLVPRRSELPK